MQTTSQSLAMRQAHAVRSSVRSRAAAASATCIMAAGAAVTAASFASAQCLEGWQPGYGIAGANDTVNIITRWDPDGRGPAPETWVIGGRFTVVGETLANRIAYWDGAAWQPLGTGMDGPVNAIAALSNGELIAGGSFTDAGGNPAASLARWNGASWSAIDDGVDDGLGEGRVEALFVASNGDLYVGGSFLAAGTVFAKNIARYDGVLWTALGTGANGVVNAIAEASNGDIIIGGQFSNAGGSAAGNVARWNGASWSSVGNGVGAGNYVRAVAVLTDGDIVIGTFVPVPGAGSSVARLDGANWASLGSAGVGQVSTLVPLAENHLLVSGYDSSRLVEWDGVAWTSYGSGISGGVEAMAAAPSGEIMVGGTFSSAGLTLETAIDAPRLALFDGQWSTAAGPGFDGICTSVASLSDGSIVVGGEFTNIGGTPASHVSRGTDSGWEPLGSGLTGVGHIHVGSVLALAQLDNGDIVAGGSLRETVNPTYYPIKRWDGSSWSTLGGSIETNGPVLDLTVMPNGDLIACGEFSKMASTDALHISRWDGTGWHPIGDGFNHKASALGVLNNGEIVASIQWNITGSQHYVVRWTGFEWLTMGNTFNGVISALAVLPDGTLFAAGSFSNAGGTPALRIARWTGTGWAAVGSGFNAAVHALAVLGDGSLVAGGDFTSTGATPVSRLARWNGTSWSAIDLGVNGPVRSLAARDGGFVAAGLFSTANGQVSAYVAEWHPATVEGDVNCDGAVNGFDIAMVLGSWGPCEGCRSDLNGDGVVDGADLAIVLGNWTG